MADVDHARIVEALGNSHEQRLLDILEELESEIASLLDSAPVTDGKLNDLSYAVKSRTGIRDAFRNTYLTEIDSIIREYDQVIESMSEMWSGYGQAFQVPQETITALKEMTFQGFQDIGSTFANDIADEIYHSTLAGRSREDAVRNIRQKVNGVYMESDQAEINRLVEIAKKGGKEGEDAVAALHRQYAADRTGRNMRRYAKQMIHDAISQFDAGIAVAAGKEIDAEKWVYFGSLVEDSREICVELVNADKSYTEEQIRTMWEARNWSGKADGDPFIVRGGYNCRHLWRPSFGEE